MLQCQEQSFEGACLRKAFASERLLQIELIFTILTACKANSVYLFLCAHSAHINLLNLQAKGVSDAGNAAFRVSGMELGGLFGSLLAGRISDALIAKNPKGGNVGKRVQASLHQSSTIQRGRYHHTRLAEASIAEYVLCHFAE